MSEMLFAALESVVDEESFLTFVTALAKDRQAAESLPMSIDGHQGHWANQTISAYLEAARSWADDSEFGQRPGPKSSNPWRLFASFLWAGRGY